MKVREFIAELKKHDPDAVVVALGHRDFFYPVTSIQKLLLNPITIYEQTATKVADAYRDTGSSDEGDPCVEISID
jgi:hypothetical protein